MPRPAAAAAAAAVGPTDTRYVELDQGPVLHAAITASNGAKHDGSDDDDSGYDTDLTDAFCAMCQRAKQRSYSQVCDGCWPEYTDGMVPSTWVHPYLYAWWLLIGFGESKPVLPHSIAFGDAWFWHKSLSITEFPGATSFHLMGSCSPRDFSSSVLAGLRRRQRSDNDEHVFVDLGPVITRVVIQSHLARVVATTLPTKETVLCLPQPEYETSTLQLSGDDDDDDDQSTRGNVVKQLIVQAASAPSVIMETTALPWVLCLMVAHYWRPTGAPEWRSRKAVMDTKARELNAFQAKARAEMVRLHNEWQALSKQQHVIEAVFKEDENLHRTEVRGTALCTALRNAFMWHGLRTANTHPANGAATRALKRQRRA